LSYTPESWNDVANLLCMPLPILSNSTSCRRCCCETVKRTATSGFALIIELFSALLVRALVANETDRAS
jgi:hypothetical protein